VIILNPGDISRAWIWGDTNLLSLEMDGTGSKWCEMVRLVLVLTVFKLPVQRFGSAVKFPDMSDHTQTCKHSIAARNETTNLY
jgi:hypothetical protein